MLTLTLEELKEKLIQHKDVDELLELLQIEPEELLDRFEDHIEERYAGLCKELTDVEAEESGS